MTLKSLLTNNNSSLVIKIFFAVAIFKLILGALFGSMHLTNYFLPFLNYTIESSFSNPYEFYAQNERTEIFPYPALMLYAMLLPKVLFGWINDWIHQRLCGRLIKEWNNEMAACSGSNELTFRWSFYG